MMFEMFGMERKTEPPTCDAADSGSIVVAVSLHQDLLEDVAEGTG